MIRSFLTVLVLASTTLTVACGTVQTNTGDDTAVVEQSGSDDIVWGSAGSSSSGSDDSGDTTDSGGDSGSGLPETDDTASDTDSGTVAGPIDAELYIYEDTVDTNVAMYGVANVTTGDYSEYSSAYASTSDGSKGNGWLRQSVTYTPGVDVLAMNCQWSDGTTNPRYCAEAGALLTNVKYILIVFPDNTYDQYVIGTSSDVGHAYIKDSGSYHDWMIVTTDHTTGDYTM